MRVSSKIQTMVGLFVLFVLGCFVYLSVNVGFKLGKGQKDYYQVTATFQNVNGLKDQAAVKIGGIQVGYVKDIILDENLTPKVIILIDKEYNKIPDTSVLSIKTNGILGDKFLDLKVGFSDPEFSTFLENNSVIANTISSVDLEDLISKFALGDSNKSTDKPASTNP